METRIYGEHDEKTIKQLNRCMQVDSAVKGVLCADGHLSYAHPIGGVVAPASSIPTRIEPEPRPYRSQPK